MTALTTPEKENPMGSYHQSGTFFKDERTLRWRVPGVNCIVGEQLPEIPALELGVSKQLREALINAMVHNDYSSEIPPVIEIYSDRIAITSYGGLVHGLSREEFLAGRSMPRNRELMRVFRDLDLVEQLGSGVHRILSAYDSSVFKISDHFFEISFPVPESLSRQTPQVTPQVVMLLQRAESAASAGVLQQEVGLKDRVHFLKTYLSPLLDAGWIERTIPDKPRSSRQKYRLTSQGRTILENQ